MQRPPELGFELPELDDGDRARRKAFLQLDEKDEARLLSLGQHLSGMAKEFADQFYAHLLAHEETRVLLDASPGRLERLRSVQARYFQRLFEGNYDRDYFAERLQVGRTHDRVGLLPEHYLGAFCLYLQLTIPKVCEIFGVDYGTTGTALQSLIKIVFLDLGLAIDSYLDARVFELERSRNFLERVLTSISDGVFVVDPTGVLVEANPTLCAMVECSRGELLGRLASDLWGEPSDAAMRARMEIVQRDGEYHVDRSLTRKDGRTIPVSFSAGAIRGPDERLVGYVGVVRDMTAQQALVRALEQSKVTLEQRVEERTRALQETQAQLLQAEKLSAIGQLAAGIAHEIGTPLNVISGRAEYLLEELGEGDPRGQSLRVIVSQIDRITGLIHKLLDFARDRGEAQGSVRLARVASGILPLVETLMRKRNIELVCKVDDLPDVIGNANQLQQVFLNLLVNAADAIRDAKPTRAGRIEITGDPEASHVLIRVRDNGCGINAEDLPRIFNPFFTTKPTGQGTGLGLSVTYGLVREMGGSLRAESKPGEGTTFELHLRRAAARTKHP